MPLFRCGFVAFVIIVVVVVVAVVIIFVSVSFINIYGDNLISW